MEDMHFEKYRGLFFFWQAWGQWAARIQGKGMPLAALDSRNPSASALAAICMSCGWKMGKNIFQTQGYRMELSEVVSYCFSLSEEKYTSLSICKYIALGACIKKN